MPRLDEGREQLVLTFEGVSVTAQAGESVAAALIASGVRGTRQSVSGAPRGPYCMMGACFECLVEIDGRANKQACLVPAAHGMQVRRQRQATPAAADGMDDLRG